MPLKPVISVDVDDSKFKAFLELFQKYQDALKTMPGDWGKIEGAVGKAGFGFGEMTAAVLAQLEILHRVERETHSVEQATTRAGRAMQVVSGHARNVAQHVGEVTRHLLKWTEIGGLVGGVLGGGGLWGIDRLASNASNLRTSAAGVGVNPAALLAARVNFGQFFNAQGALGNIANLQQSLTGQVAFNTLGIPGEFGGSPGSALGPALNAIHRLYNQTPASQRQNMPWWQSAVQILGSAEAVRTVGGMSSGELRQHESDYQADISGGFGMGSGTLVAAQNVERQLTRVGNTLEYTFLASLKPVMPELESLSKALGGTVTAFLKSDGFKWVVDKVATGLHDFSTWVSGDGFKQDVAIFVDGVGALAKAVAAAMKWFGANFGSTQPLSAEQQKSEFQAWVESQGGPAAGGDKDQAKWRKLWVNEPKNIPAVTKWLRDHPVAAPFSSGSGIGYSAKALWGYWNGSGGGASPGQSAFDAATTIKDPETAAAAGIIAWRESRDKDVNNGLYHVTGQRNGVDLGYTVSGYYQILDTNWHNYGQGIVDFSKYPHARGAPRELQDAVFARMYHANGYAPWDAAHGGSISSDRAFHEEMQRRLHPVSGELAAPAAASPRPTAGQLILGGDAAGRAASSSQVKITVENATGGSAVVSSSQLAIP